MQRIPGSLRVLSMGDCSMRNAAGRAPVALYNHHPGLLFDINEAGGAALRTRSLVSTMWNGRQRMVVVEGCGAR